MARASLPGDDMQQNDWLDLLDEEGIEVLVVQQETDLDGISPSSLPQLVFLELDSMSRAEARDCVAKCKAFKLPVITLVPRQRVANLDVTLEISDFVVTPPDPDELVTRVKQALWRTRLEQGEDVIRVGDLVINPSTYEVSLKGKRVNLRFKEYELLRLLVTNPGRVYTREALLSSVWGYDYFGGTRTVDVHIRRLRSKIEDAEHSFIETIWNVGYRFRDMHGQS
jgi:DNA-binding response OmpR family regulator